MFVLFAVVSVGKFAETTSRVAGGVRNAAAEGMNTHANKHTIPHWHSLRMRFDGAVTNF